ncbi:MAG: penicillin-binding protein 2, partial [Campylobacter sp.]|nr:penicillin-binding protein 2 [Campylobacter sp.]
MNTSQSRVYLIFICIAFFTAVFAGFTLYRVTLDRSLPKINISDEDSALRGDIITSDGFSVATSQKLYSAVVNTRNIDPNKKELFINLYSLYSGADPKKVEKILKSKGAVTLSKDLNAKDAAHLRELARKLYRTKVFIPYEDPKTGIVTTQGLDVTESGEKRSYIAGDTLTPLIGYTSKKQKGKITKASGVKGIEKFYEDQLDDITNESLKGPRDLSNTIILSGESKLKRRKDGYNVVLNINLRLQQMLEKMIDERAKSLIAKEIILAVMEAKTGKILALTSTKRYNPGAITQKDYEALNSSASEYAYEMGSVMKPIIFSLALQENKINPLENINVYGGKYKLGRRTITDSHKADSLSAEEVIIRSSNIGMINVIERLDDASIYNGLRNFGFAQKTGVDLSHEQTGKIPQIRDLKNRTYKATLSYGYGIQATFMQLLSAYNAINNGGVMMEP